jgi:hypothetical protein
MSFKHTDLMDSLLETCRENFVQDGYVSPVAFLVIADKVNIFAAAALEKEQIAQMLHQMGAMPETQAIIFIDEAWMLVSKHQLADDSDMRAILDGYAKVADHPFREEVVIATLESRIEGNFQYIAPISRQTDGSATLGEWRKQSYKGGKGQLQGFLK